MELRCPSEMAGLSLFCGDDGTIGRVEAGGAAQGLAVPHVQRHTDGTTAPDPIGRYAQLHFAAWPAKLPVAIYLA